MSDDTKETQTQTQEPSPEEKLNSQINSAITGHMKRLEKNAAQKEADMKAYFADQLKSWKPTVSEEPPPDKANKPDPKMTALEQRLAQMDTELKESKAAREKAENKQREDRSFGDLREVLKSKVRPDMVDFVAENLFYAKRRVEFDADGNALFKSKRSDGEEVLLPLADGVATWLASKEAAGFLPAPDPQNNQRGTRMPTTKQTGGMPKYDAPATTDEEKVKRAQERAAAYRAQQGNR